MTQVKNNTQSFKFGTSKRIDVVKRGVIDLPGPGNYNDKSSFSEGKGFSMGKRSSSKLNDNPGPGSYNQTDAINRVRSGSQSYRFGSSQRIDVVKRGVIELPGPGNYNDKS